MDKVLGTNCAQAVRSTGRNHEDRFPHLPHHPVNSTLSTAAMCTKSGSFGAVIRVEHAALYTGKGGKLTELRGFLSPVSTAPTITTTTYI